MKRNTISQRATQLNAKKLVAIAIFLPNQRTLLGILTFLKANISSTCRPIGFLFREEETHTQSTSKVGFTN